MGRFVLDSFVATFKIMVDEVKAGKINRYIVIANRDGRHTERIYYSKLPFPTAQYEQKPYSSCMLPS
jgi:hypothetical protein